MPFTKEALNWCNQGERFWLADGALQRTCEADPDPGVAARLNLPGIVMSAFDSECFLKSLLVAEGKSIQPRLRTHHLGKLFGALDDPTKKVILSEWKKMIAATEHQLVAEEERIGRALPRDIETSLDDCGEAFLDFRYWFEDPSKSVKFYIPHLPRVLWNSVNAIHFSETAET